MKEISIGDSLWIPRTDRKQERVPCPVCFTKKHVTLILGDDSCVEVECDYCGKGYGRPQGTVVDYTQEPRAEPFRVDTIRAETTEKGAVFEYKSGCYIARDGDLFPTEEEAVEEAKRRMVEQQKEQDCRADRIKKNQHKSFTWNVGYYKSEIKRCREQLERYEHKMRLCEERARPKKEAPDEEQPTP
jgi:hypothetical protein